MCSRMLRDHLIICEMIMWLWHRLFGPGVTSEDEKLKEEFQRHMNTGSDVLVQLISDYIPWLSVVTAMQGHRAKMEAHRRNAYTLGVKLQEVEKHRQRAAQRQLNSDPDYIPDFVDTMLNSPLHNGNVLPDRQISMIVLVRSNLQKVQHQSQEAFDTFLHFCTSLREVAFWLANFWCKPGPVWSCPWFLYDFNWILVWNGLAIFISILEN